MCVEGSMFHFLPNNRLMDEDSNLSDSSKGWDTDIEAFGAN